MTGGVELAISPRFIGSGIMLTSMIESWKPDGGSGIDQSTLSLSKSGSGKSLSVRIGVTDSSILVTWGSSFKSCICGSSLEELLLLDNSGPKSMVAKDSSRALFMAWRWLMEFCKIHYIISIERSWISFSSGSKWLHANLTWFIRMRRARIFKVSRERFEMMKWWELRGKWLGVIKRRGSETVVMTTACRNPSNQMWLVC